MWIQFQARPYAARILPDRTAFYYFPGEVLDLPRAWAEEHLAAGEAVPAAPPAPFQPPEPLLLPSLGDEAPTVACVWRTGGPYDAHDYVGRLARGVARNLTLPHRFVCLTDFAGELPEGVERIPLLHRWPGFWPKVELFRPGLFRGPVLYLDLDTVVCGPLDALAAAEDTILAAWDLKHGWLNSSFLRWSVDLSCVYARMERAPQDIMASFAEGGLYGDQGLLQETLEQRCIPWRWVQDRFPELVQWHPYTERHLPAPAGTSVALWYGHPKPHEATGDWLAQHWR
jgi:hypothetical protein